MRRGFQTFTCVVLAVALAFMCCPYAALSQEGRGAPGAAGMGAPGAVQAGPSALVYKPPMRGAPAGGGRIAAAVRGAEGDALVLIALAPDHVGVTSQSQPVLYWYISKPTSSRIEFSLNDELKSQTLFKTELAAPKKGGILEIKLADYNVELSAGVVYQWFVSVEADPGQPAKDVYNGGSIVYQEPSPDLKKRVASAGSAGAAGIYAGEGLWYDALTATWKAGKSGEEKLARPLRISLLKQVGFGVPDTGKPKSALDGEEEVLHFLDK
ncbi:MAG: DUF928 domain-containing protein [Syntrophobacteraceae bacterium]